MVFKVKQRAEINYFAKTKDALDDQRFKFKFKAGQNERSADYSYNWPYDFFSLVETAKIDMSVTLRNKKLIEDVELQELNDKIALEPKPRPISLIRPMRRISISASAVRLAARAASKATAKAAIAAKYGPVTVTKPPTPAPRLATPRIVGPTGARFK